jgi:hypothetical protein
MADKITTDDRRPTDARGDNIVILAERRPASPTRLSQRGDMRHHRLHAQPLPELDDDGLDFAGDMFLDPAAGPQSLVAPAIDPGITWPQANAGDGPEGNATD